MDRIGYASVDAADPDDDPWWDEMPLSIGLANDEELILVGLMQL